jgi:tRNA(fMet)-specific endonuclease VapC
VRLLVDTSRFADLVANDPLAHEVLQRASEIWLSLITVGELMAGFSEGSRRKLNERRLSELLRLQGVGVLLLDTDTPRYYANVWQSLRRKGTPIPTNDIWIAAQALQHNLVLDTRDEHFRLVPGLKLLDETQF